MDLPVDAEISLETGKVGEDMLERDATIPAAAPKQSRLEPTRYGDWELNGKCVDF